LSSEKYDNDNNNSQCDQDKKIEAVSISRIDYAINTDIILEANRTAKNPIKIYGSVDWGYVYDKLDVQEFKNHYRGIFDKSFNATSDILNKAKFMVDMSAMPHKDGGGTQYTFLEAIHNNTSIILNRRWIDNVDKKYRDFQEGYNCYAVSDGQELAELLNSDIDTQKVIGNAKKIIDRHIKVDWFKVIK
jgi:hypothetical protein